MAAIFQETEKDKPSMADVSCGWSRLKDKSPSATDKELECANDLYDGYSWALYHLIGLYKTRDWWE